MASKVATGNIKTMKGDNEPLKFITEQDINKELNKENNVPTPCNVKSSVSNHKKEIMGPGEKLIGQGRSLWSSVTSIRESIAYLWNRDKSDVNWIHVGVLSTLQIAAILSMIFLVPNARWQTFVFWGFMHFFVGFGVTAGCHRLWSHKSFTATMPLRIFLVGLQTLAYQNSVWTWVRDHRLHHKASETDADPHDSRRGLFFAHVGWLMVHKTKEAQRMGRAINMDDITADPILRFQRRHYGKLSIGLQLIVSMIPVLIWKESFLISLGVQICRMNVNHHITWFINSIAHWEGSYDYNDRIFPCEALAPAIFALGEGWHNFHHTFPSDYRTSDAKPFVLRPLVNSTWVFIDVCIALGLATKPVITSERLISKFQDKYGRAASR